ARHHGQCRSILGYWHWGGTCGINTDSLDGLRGHTALLHHGPNGVLQSFDMIQWVLAKLIDSWIAVFLCLPSGIPKNFRGQLCSVLGIYQYGPYRIGTII